jgi:hypothetical protein
LTLVNGELVDADVDGLEGEQAAYEILAWTQPHTTILDGVTLFRNTVKTSIASLIVEATRRQDEAIRDRHLERRTVTSELSGTGRLRREGKHGSEWQWLVETLVMSGAAAAVIRAHDERILAQAKNDDFDHGANLELSAEFTPVLRAASHWARQSFPAIDEVAMRMGNRHALITPLDEDRRTFVCAVFAEQDALEHTRAALKSFPR